MFTTRLNKQLLIYVGSCPDPHTFNTNALSMDWDILPYPYLFSPSPFISVVLQKGKQSSNTFPFIALLWPHQSWYPDLISLYVDHPLCLSQTEDLLVQDLPRQYWVHPNLGLFQYHAWLLSGSTSKQQAFRQTQQTELPCNRVTSQDSSIMPSGRNFDIGGLDRKQIQSQSSWKICFKGLPSWQ